MLLRMTTMLLHQSSEPAILRHAFGASTSDIPSTNLAPSVIIISTNHLTRLRLVRCLAPMIITSYTHQNGQGGHFSLANS